MKKLVILVLILLMGIGIIWKYFSLSNGSVPTDPTETVNSFMKTTQKISTLIWNEKERNILKADLQKWQKSEREGKLPESFKKYEIDEPAILFKDKEYGKTAFGTLCLYEIESFSVRNTNIKGNEATVNVEFTASDFIGLGKVISELGAPQQKKRPKPTPLVFQLKKYWKRWYIVKLEGKAAELINANYRMRKFQ